MNESEIFDEFNSLNGGISMCQRALAGVLINHGLNKVMHQIDDYLLKEERVQTKNDLFFIGKGLKALDSVVLENKVEIAKINYQAWINFSECFDGNDGAIQEAGHQWKEVALQVKTLCVQLGKNCNTEYVNKIECIPFGIVSPLTKAKFLNWTELDSDFINFSSVKIYFDTKVSELLTFLEEMYINGNIHDHLDIHSLVCSIDALNNEHDRVIHVLRERCDLWQGVDTAKSKFQDAMSELVQELAKLPHSAQLGLFCNCNPRFSKEGHFPNLFSLENIKLPEL